jgi:outer membrane receptor protein involved in Fe transport
MKNKIIIILLITFQITFAQKKDENIGTEVVNVVKPYTPSVSDAFKIKETPVLDAAETSKKEEIKYQIFSFPVASTFSPSKGKAAGVDKEKQERLFPNYATLGFGNYDAINAELFVTQELDKYQYVGGMFRHQSSQGGIKGVVLDDKFYDSSLDLMYGYQRKDITWKTDFGFKNEIYNWYGLPLENPLFSPTFVKNVNPKHEFNTLKITSNLAIEDSFFNQTKINFIRFWDDYGSSENRFIIQPELTFDFEKTAVKTKFKVDYLNTSFDTSYLVQASQPTDVTNIQKSNLIVSINPSFQYLKDDLSVEIGGELTYFSRVKDVYVGIKYETKSKFLIYPKVIASYKVVGDLMIAFGGLEGGLIQNSYADFANQNKFISPTLAIEPTNLQFDLYGGLKGKLSSVLAYNVKASISSSKNKAFFKSNPFLNVTPAPNNYSYGNSFEVIYDNMRTFSLFGELKADINKDISVGLNAELHDYATDNQMEAWNLPTVKTTFTTNFTIGKKWYAGAQLFYVGERKEEFTTIGFPTNTNLIINLDGYLDINANVGYKYNERLNVFLKGNNLANQNYNRWLNYPVQGAQVILGASYKFDF